MPSCCCVAACMRASGSCRRATRTAPNPTSTRKKWRPERRTAVPKALAPPRGDSAQREGGHMRHPGSTPCVGGGEVKAWVVRPAVDPSTPKHAQPSTREDADGMRMGTATCTRFGVDVARPVACLAGVIGHAHDGLTKAMVAGPAESDAARFTGLIGNGDGTGFGGELLGRGETFAHIAELGEDLRSTDTAGAWEGHDDLPVGQRLDEVLDASGEFADLHDQGLQHVYQRSDDLRQGLA